MRGTVLRAQPAVSRWVKMLAWVWNDGAVSGSRFIV